MKYKIEKAGAYLRVSETTTGSVQFNELASSTRGVIENGVLHLRDKETHRNNGVFSVTDLQDTAGVQYTTSTLNDFIDSNTGDSTSVVGEEVKKLTAYNTPGQELLDGESKTYSGFKSIAVEIYNGSGTILVEGGTAVLYPITGDKGTINGAVWTLDTISNKTLTVDVTGGKAFVTFVK